MDTGASTPTLASVCRWNTWRQPLPRVWEVSTLAHLVSRGSCWPRDRRADLAPAGVTVFRGREVPVLLCGAAAGRALAWHTPASASSQALLPHPTRGKVLHALSRPRVAMVLCFWPGSAHSEAQGAPSGWVGLGTERPQAPCSTLHIGVVSAHSAPLQALCRDPPPTWGALTGTPAG